MAFTAETFRVECPVESHLPGINRLTSQLPTSWRGVNWRFEFAFLLGQALADISGLASLTMEIKSLDDITGPPILTATLDASSLNPSLTLEQWQAGAAQHAVFEFAHGDTNLDLGGAKSAKFWVVIKGLSSETEPSRVVGGITLLTVEEAGANDAEPPTPGDPGYYTKAEIDALLALRLKAMRADEPLWVYEDPERLGQQCYRMKIANGSAIGQVLQWDGTKWMSLDGAATLYVTCPTDGAILAVSAKKEATGYTIQLDQRDLRGL